MGNALDDLVSRQAAYETQVATCLHVWGPGVLTLGQRCSGCGVYELTWHQTKLAERTRELEEAKATLGNDTPWPLGDVLARLIQGCEHLLIDHACDQHGYEALDHSVRAGRRYLGALAKLEQKKTPTSG